MKKIIQNQPKYMKFNTQLLLILLMAMPLFFAQAAFAQYGEGAVSDPLKKPHLWEKLRANPNDSTLWVNYMGKRWGAMTAREKARVAQWKQELYIQSIADQESIIGKHETAGPKFERATDAFAGQAPGVVEVRPKNILTEMEAKQLAGVEAIIMQEREDVKQLKNNISENFVILEDTYRDIFAEFGVNYRYYREVHPDGKYSEQKWIEEQETLIRLHKVQKVKELRQQFTIVK